MLAGANTRRGTARPEYALGEEAVLSISGSLNEPRWLREQRLSAWRSFATTTDSLYDRHSQSRWVSDITSLRLERLRALAPSSKSGAESRDRSLGRFAARAAFRNSSLHFLKADSRLEAMGVLISDLPTAVQKWPELVREHLGSLVVPEDGKFASLATALWSNGLFVYVPSGANVDLPIGVAVAVDSPSLSLSWRTLVVADRGSKVTIVEETSSAKRAGGSLFSGLFELKLEDGARVDYAAVEGWGHGVSCLTTKRAMIGRDARLRWASAYLSAELTRSDSLAILAEPNAELESIGLFFAEEHQQLDIAARVVHAAPYTRANVLLNGAVKDNAHASFAGTLRVERTAVGAESYLGSHTLTLSDKARVDSIPSLEIEQNDVRVSHGSTAGKLDEEQLFYLTTRGLSRSQARRTLIRGFFEPVLARLPSPETRRQVERSLERKIAR